MKLWICTACLAGCALSFGLGTPVPAQERDQPKLVLNDREKRLIDLTNKVRKKNNLPLLQVDAALVRLARKHSGNMAKQQKLDHFLDGKGPFQRMRDAKYQYRHAGENVAYGDFKIDKIFDLWIKSPAHKKNILDKRYTHIGLGSVQDDKGVSWYTQMFAKPKR